MLNRIFSKKSNAKAAADEGQGSLLDLLEEEQANVVDFPTGRPSDGSLLSALNDAEVEAESARQVRQAEELVSWQQGPQTSTGYVGAANPESLIRSNAEPSRSAPRKPQSVDSRQQEQLDLLSQELAEVAALMTERSSGAQPTEAQNPNPELQAPSWRKSAPVSSHPERRLAAGLSFDQVAAALLRKWWFVFVCGFFGACLAAIYALSMPNKYLSVAEILIEPRGVKVIENTVMPTELNSQATIAYAESQVRILTSSSVLDPVIEDLELADDPEFNGTSPVSGLFGQIMRAVFGSPEDPRENFSAAKEYLYENMFVARINQTFTIQIGATTEEPAKSARIANAVARGYINAETRAKSSAARNATEDLTGRLDELRALVRQSEEKVEAYKAENGLVDAEGKLVSEVQLARLNDQLAIVQAQVSDARSRAEQAAQADLSDVISGALSTALASPTVSQLRVAYSRAKSQLDKISTTLGERHPERIAAQAELRSARQAIANELSRIVESAQEDYRSSRARLTDIRGQVNTLKASAVEDSAAKVKLRELERDVEANRRVYESFLLRSRETGEQENIRSESARIITEATPPVEKEGPNRKLITLAGGATGGLIGMLLVLLPLIFSVLRQIASGQGLQTTYPQQPAYDDDLYTSHASEVVADENSTAAPHPMSQMVNTPAEVDAQSQIQPATGATGETAAIRGELDALRREVQNQRVAQTQAQSPLQPQPGAPQAPPTQMPLFSHQPVYAPPAYAAYPQPVLPTPVMYAQPMPQPVPMAYPAWPTPPAPQGEPSK